VATVSLRNKSGGPLRVGSPDGPLVDDDAVYKVDGKKAKDQPADALVIDTPAGARAFPTATWSEVSSKEND
jgi:hypothetical protein